MGFFPPTDVSPSSEARRLRRAILAQLGLASLAPLGLAACSSTLPDGDDGNVTTNAGSNGEASSSSEGEVSSSDDGESGWMEDSDDSDDSNDDGIKYDVGGKLDVPPDPACWSFSHSDATLAVDHPDCELGPFDPNLFVDVIEICVDRPPGGDCADICPPEELCTGMTSCWWGEAFDTCGIYESESSCCLVVAGEPLPPIGRPFAIAGRPRLAEVSTEFLAGDRLARHWLATAQGEHASVAAFARFVAVLQRFGAPAKLVADAIAAAADEVRHTQAALGLASRFCGRPRVLGPLAIDGALAEADDLAAALRAAVIEGCIDETLAAHEAACLAARASDPEVAAALERVAADEARHAALAWRFVAWVLDRRPRLRAVAAAAFCEVEPPAVPELDAPDTALLDRGCPPPSLRASWRRVALRELVDPCAAALLGAAPLAARATS